YLALQSRELLLEPAVADAALKAADDAGLRAAPTLVYLSKLEARPRRWFLAGPARRIPRGVAAPDPAPRPPLRPLPPQRPTGPGPPRGPPHPRGRRAAPAPHAGPADAAAAGARRPGHAHLQAAGAPAGTPPRPHGGLPLRRRRADERTRRRPRPDAGLPRHHR